MSLFLQVLAFVFLRVCSNSCVLPPHFLQHAPQLQLLFLAVIQSPEFVLQKNIFFFSTRNSLKYNVTAIRRPERGADA